MGVYMEHHLETGGFSVATITIEGKHGLFWWPLTNRNEVVSQFGTPKSHEMIYELFFFPTKLHFWRILHYRTKPDRKLHVFWNQPKVISLSEALMFDKIRSFLWCLPQGESCFEAFTCNVSLFFSTEIREITSWIQNTYSDYIQMTSDYIYIVNLIFGLDNAEIFQYLPILFQF